MNNVKFTENNNPELQKGGEYIIKRTRHESFYVKVLNVTKKLYHFKYENGNTTWMEKDYYNQTYTLVEDISEFQLNIGIFMEQEFEMCPMCTGSGQITDDKSTAGTKICPVCTGSGQIIKRTLIKG